MRLLNKIFAPISLLISLLLFVYTFYVSEILWVGDKRDYYLVYYIVSLILIICSILFFFISEKIKEYLIISLTSIVLSLYIFESYVIFKKQFTKEKFSELELKRHIYAKKNELEFDTRSKLEVYNDLKKTENNIAVRMPSSSHIKSNNNIFALSGISNSKIINCNENGYYSNYESDRYGFNNPDSEHDQNTIEYLIVGDSFVHGDCVNRPNDIASILRELSGKPVLNLGQPGNGPLIEYAALREYLIPNVKKVLWVFYQNDLENLDSELKNKILIKYLNDLTFTQNLKLKQNEIDKMLKRMMYVEENYFFKFLKLSQVRQAIYRYFSNKSEQDVQIKKLKKKKNNQVQDLQQDQDLLYDQELLEDQDLLQKMKIVLELVKDLTTENNSELYFVILPDYSRYIHNMKVNNKGLKKIVSNLDIPFIDIHKEVFEKEENPINLFPLRLFGHYNKEGYKKVSEAIFNFTK